VSELALLGGTPVRPPPSASWPEFDATDEAELLNALRSGHWSRWDGEMTSRFEREFATYLGARHVLAVSSGTAALQLALLAAGVEPGDHVIVPAYSFVAPIAAVLECGAVPIFADVQAETMCLDPVDAEQRLTSRTTALLPMHIGGSCADIAGLKRLAERRGLILVEDAALALGSVYRDRRVGTFGRAGTFSFQAEKNLAAGEGGALATDDDAVYERALSAHDFWKGRLFPQEGWDQRFWNFRISELQSALLIRQLSRLEEQTVVRSRNGELLDQRLADVRGVSPAKGALGTQRRSFALYAFRIPIPPDTGITKDRVVGALVAEGVPAVTGYRQPVYGHPIFRDRNLAVRSYPHLRDAPDAGPCPIAERLAEVEAVWLSQQSLLCDTRTVHDFADGIEKVATNLFDLSAAPDAKRAS
jgi:perosamine synthetase